MSEAAVRCSGLVKRYGEVVAVDGLDLEVRPGECFGLLGPNGAGKTTTVECLEGIRTPDGGTVEVLGESWERDGERLRDRLGIQLQETQLTEKLSVLETVTLFRSFYARGVAPGVVLEQVGLTEKAGSWVRHLSGGQRQRLSLACALVCEPEVLFLDEPTTGLDPQSRRKAWEIVDDFRRRGGTVLLTTHYMEEAERLCDRVAVVDHGRVIALGTPAELVASLGAEHVVELDYEGELEAAPLEAIEGVEELIDQGGAAHLTVGELHRTLPLLLTEVERQGTTLTRLTTHHATLEDVFLSLTGRQLRDE
ncbi:MAG: ABC transporter ATP-binding protein [Thermoanaerobaculia bacterium]|nr:ABC transporter ATP-binding protein [Thermoanaerobaculia bacterium]